MLLCHCQFLRDININMKKLIGVLLLLCMISGCKSTYDEPSIWETGEEVKPLYGCKELRKRNANADC